MIKEIEFTKGSGNIFTDLGLEHAEDLLAKSTLAIMLRNIIKKRGLTQAAAAELLGTHQTQIARLKNGKGVASMSLGLLMHWFTKLDRNVIVSIKRKPKNQDKGKIQIAI